jgi:TolB protein
MMRLLRNILISFVLCFITTREAHSFVLFDIKNDEIKQIHLLFSNIYCTKEFKNQNIKGDNNIKELTKEQKEEIRKNVEIVNNIIDLIKKDLLITNLFTITTQNKEGTITYYAETPDFTNYKGIDALLRGEFDITPKGEIELKLILWDLLDERQSFGKIYGFDPKNYKKVANIIADEIYKNLTGEEKGFFNSKIAYVAESGDVRQRKRKLVTIDFDGSNRKEITYGNKTLVTPLFSRSNSNNLFFVGYGDKETLKIYDVNMNTGLIKQIGNINDMTFSPNYNPVDPNSIILSATKDGVTDIYTFNLNTNESKQLTDYSSIDTTPSYSPDGEKIVFCSDREGSQKLYIMDSNGSDVTRLTNSRGLYSKPAWSPDGRLIAFIKILDGEFSIGVITPDGENERILVTAYSLEGVKWSPNGRYLIYSKQLGAYGKQEIPYLYIMDILTGYEYRIPTPMKEGATDPDWIEA